MEKRILIVVDSLKIGGGSDKFAAILGTELYNYGYHVSYLTLMDENPKYSFKGDYYTLNERDIYGNDLRRGLDFLTYAPKIKRLCEDLNIDTIISAGDPANFQALISRFIFKNKVRIILTQHMNPEIFLDSPLKFRLIKYCFPRADKVVCVSKDVERILNENYGVENTLTIYNMVDIEKNIKLSLEELPDEYNGFFEGKNNKKNFHFINVGRLDYQKGQYFLIRSFRRVVDYYGNARLLILGEGDLRGNLQDLITSLGLNENVFLLGEVENVFPFLISSDCFVLSSLWEGLPLSLIEALSMNLPVISTDCKTGPREILCPELDLDEKINYPYLGKHAILTHKFHKVPVFSTVSQVSLNKSEAMLADLMIRMIEDPDLIKNYSNGRVVAKNFDKEKIITQWDTLLK